MSSTNHRTSAPMPRTARIVVTGHTGRFGQVALAEASRWGIVTGISAPVHDLLASAGSWHHAVAEADGLIHLAGIIEFGTMRPQAVQSLQMATNVMQAFDGRLLVVASSVAVEPERFGMFYRYNNFCARLEATECFARAWASERPGHRAAVALRLGYRPDLTPGPTRLAPDYQHEAVRVDDVMLGLHLQDALAAPPGFHIRYAIGKA